MKAFSKTPGWILHVILWLGYSLLLFYGPFVIIDNTADALLFAGRVLIIHVTLFYVNTFFLLPRFFARSKYFVYIFLLLITLGFSSVFYKTTDDYLSYRKGRRPFPAFVIINHYPDESTGPGDKEDKSPDDLIKDTLNNIDYFSHHHRPPEIGPAPFFKTLFGLTRPGTLSSIGILFISTLFWMVGNSRKQKESELSLHNLNLKNEMNFLKSQINPHFLFNALNNIYSLSIQNSVKTSDMVLKLSSMLRYILYDSDGRKVTLAKEVEYILNFIDFQRVKIEGIPNLHVDIERINGSLPIEPMLLIPFIENSFKYSKVEDIKKGWIRMVLTTDRNRLRFELRNSVFTGVNSEKLGGIGIENTRQRLELLYPEKHKLFVAQKDNEFMVLLKIDLDEN